MSNTVITNYTDLNGPSTKADSSVVVIVNKDGSLSVDQNLLGTLMGTDGSQGAGISVVRVGHEGRPDDATDSENEDDKVPHVTLSVDSYYDEPSSIIKYDSGAEMLQSLRIETRENSLVGFQNDHCYTPLISPTQGVPQRSDSFSGYDEPVIEITHTPPPKPMPQSKKITILEQQIIPKGRKIIINPTETAVVLKGNDVLNKPLPVLSKIKQLSDAEKSSENSESSSISSGDSIPDRDSDSDYKETRERPSLRSVRKSKVKPRILKVTPPKGGKFDLKSSKLKPIKQLQRKDIREKTQQKNIVERKQSDSDFLLSKEVLTPEATPPVAEISKVVTKQTPKSVKKEKRTPSHVTALLSDMTSLFSTPDVIRRVSTDGKTPGKPDKESAAEKKQVSLLKTQEPVDSSVKTKTAQQKTYSKQKDKIVPLENLIPQLDDASLAQILQDTTGIATNVSKIQPNPTTIVSTLNSPGLAGPLSPTLDLLGGIQPDEDGLSEDLLMHVAHLVESSENLQEVIDKLPANGAKPVQPAPAFGEPPALPPPEYTPPPLRAPSKAPIEIVRRDGRVITLPPIEAPATRSSKRKSQLEGAAPPPAPAPLPAPAPAPAPAAPAPAPAPAAAPVPLQPATPEPQVLQVTKQYISRKIATKKSEAPLQASPAVVEKSATVESQDSLTSEDDPYRLWCICKQPHNNRFMICCDGCEEWFHGKCVNITKAMGQQMEERGVEWRCPNCQRQARQLPKAAKAPPQQKKLNPGLPSPPTPGLVPKDSGKTGCIVCKRAARPSSIYCSDSCILKHAQDSLGVQQTPTRGDGEPGKRQDKTKSDSRVIVYERKSGRVLAGPNAPTAENLKSWLQRNPTFEVVRPGTLHTIKPNLLKKKPQAETNKVQTTLNFARIPRKSGEQSLLRSSQTPEAKERPRPAPREERVQRPAPREERPAPRDERPPRPVPREERPSRPAPREERPWRPAPREEPPPRPAPRDERPPHPAPREERPPRPAPHDRAPRRAPPPLVSPPPRPSTSTAPVGPAPAPAASLSPGEPRKRLSHTRVHSSHEKAPAVSPSTSRRKETPDTKKKMDSTEPIRENVRKSLAEQMGIRMAENKGRKFSEDEIQQFAIETERELYELFTKDVGMKYKAKYRSLMFNIKDRKNLTLWEKICDKKITPHQLVRLSPEEMASQELAQWREEESKHQLELIKKSELDLLAANKTYVLKTHKGEEVMETKKSVQTELDPEVPVEDLVIALNDSTVGEAVTNEVMQDKPDTPSKAEPKHSSRRKRERERERSSTRHKKSRRDSKREESKKSKSSRRRSDTKEEREERSTRRASKRASRPRSLSKERTERHKEGKNKAAGDGERARRRERERERARPARRSKSRSASKGRARSPSPSKSRARSPTPSKSRARSPTPSKGRARSQTPSKSRARSPTPSKSRARSPTPSKSRARSPTPSKSRARSPTPSKSRALSPTPSKGRARSPTPSKSRARSPTPSKSRARSPTPSKSRARSRSRPRSSRHKKTSELEDKQRSRSQEHTTNKSKNDSTDSEIERPKSAMLKEVHPEYDPHEPMITSAFSEEDLRKSGGEGYEDMYRGDIVGDFDTEFDPTKSFSIDANLTLPKAQEKLSEAESDQEPSSTVENSAATVWNGCINMVDVARFYVAAHEVSGSGTELEEDLTAELDIVGRINPDTVWEYIGKMKRAVNKDIVVLRLQAANDEEKMQYIALYSYLSSRNRLGVVKVSNTTAVKDFYIVPLGANTALPRVLLPLDGPGLGDARGHLLLAIVIRQRKKRAATTQITQDVIPAKVARESRKRSYTPPLLQRAATPPAPVPAPAPRLPPLPAAFTSPALSTSVKDKIAASLAAADDEEAYSPGSSCSTGSGSAAPAPAPPAADKLRSKMEELNRQIEEQKQQILKMAQADSSSAPTGEDEAYSPSRPMTPPAPAVVPLADIALPSNLHEILATIKQRSETNTDVDMRTLPLMP